MKDNTMLEETIRTYTHFIREADKLDLAYIQLVLHFDLQRALAGKTPDVPHNVLDTYRPFIKSTPIFINGDVDLENAARLVNEGIIEGVVLSRLKRLERGLPLDVPINVKTQYTKGDQVTREEKIKGYNDYPSITELLIVA